MREFNKIFVLALPRCATVSVSDALGVLGVPTAHLGRIYGEQTGEHNNPQRLMRIYEQISAGDYDLDILRECRGLADYPACAIEVFRKLDQQYPHSLFVNVRRDRDLERWIQSVERQFVGLQLLKQGKQATAEEQKFMQVMLALRAMTFGQSQFDAEVYVAAYHKYQRAIAETFDSRLQDLLEFDDVAELEHNGFARLCDFLQCPVVDLPFPNNNQHSLRPNEAFMLAIEQGRIHSQTGIKPVNC
jgi:hypothetical protein